MLRVLKDTDSYAVQKINTKQLGWDETIEETSSLLKKIKKQGNRSFFIVHESEHTHELIGYIYAEVCRSEVGSSLQFFTVLALAVNEPYHRQGVGKELLQALEEEAKERGYAAIQLDTGDSRAGAHAFYEMNGYVSDLSRKIFLKSL